ncbi:DNA-binding MarR family transcriptional regulator [Actinoplanes tereljensis]|uniref:Transcriptional regulator n=1 Tax=Paractinoplanes tereljensis TaxID=571912 RepID=A0A919P0H4_9ACTN|nr:winged helix-turn-helix domain-containing protein [Actinoplanes tereljensis]GIF27002.1 transcriptional regulator [Actinoplanes tereljensis]
MSLDSSSDQPAERRVIGDPLTLRALAHPLRLKLHALVGREGSITAAEAARQLGVSQALASHHLRQLAKYGYVEPAEAGDNRERPWRVTHTSHRFDPAENTWDEIEALQHYLLERTAAQLADWHQRRADAEPGWAEHAGISQNLVYLTLDEMIELEEAWNALIDPLVKRRPLGDTSKRPPGAIPIDVTLVAVPLRPTESGA